ncbi:MAG: hypothetical protein WC791_03115 [Candidatus Paceibacterota bacterium]|jgi:hypothetical protein
MQRRIVCAAIKNEAGDIICGARHNDSQMKKQIKQSTANWDRKTQKIVQGFIDQKNVFLTREEAFVIALLAGQIIRRCGGDQGRLYSENLY